MILGISGSPRKKTTEYVLSQALKYLEDEGFETKLITVRGRKINFCIHCDHCLKAKECIFQDGMGEIYDVLEDAEGLIFATPVYNSGVSAQLKTVMDRTRALMAKNPNALRGKVGMGIAVGGDRMGGQEIALLQIHAFFILNGVIPVSGGFFGANLGATLWSRDTLEGVMDDEEGFRSLRKTLKKFAEYLRMYGKYRKSEDSLGNNRGRR
jgi:multimeric flavodoxin WrbA